jgi:hypothetical protein
MPKFLLTMSAKNNGAIFTKSYNFEAGSIISETDLINDFKEFNPDFTDVRVISFMEISPNLNLQPIVDNSAILHKLAYA